MNKQDAIYLVIPVLNEKDNVLPLLESMLQIEETFQSRYQVFFIVVDDGSTDGTADIFLNNSSLKNIEILKHPINMGPGAAFSTALEFLHPKVNCHDYIITMEGDNTSNHHLIEKMIKRSIEGYEVILASPYMYGGQITNTTTVRVVLSSIANIFVKEILGIHGILTMSSFFRLYSGAVLKRLYKHFGKGIIERTGFECAVELLLKLIYIRATISEIPMVLDTAKRHGKSKMKVLKTIKGYFVLFNCRKAWKRQASGDF